MNLVFTKKVLMRAADDNSAVLFVIQENTELTFCRFCVFVLRKQL